MIVSDAWHPQTNGVVNTLTHTAEWLRRFGHEVRVIGPQHFRSLPCPTYPEIRLALWPSRGIGRMIGEFAPDALHIATEGPLGLAARRHALQGGLRFTTSYHTRFPQYLRARAPIPLGASYRALRWFHSRARRCMVSTASLRGELESYGFANLALWQRGVDTEMFRPRDKGALDLPRPIAGYVGRVAVEKNVAAFLSMPWEGSKVVIGDGPARASLQSSHPNAHFLGFLYGEALASRLAALDVMVFPSRTDTFGLVNLEAMACAVPVAAFPVSGPADVVEDGVTGALDENLAQAALRALAVDPAACRRRALGAGWDVCTRQFEGHLTPCFGAAETVADREALISRS